MTRNLRGIKLWGLCICLFSQLAGAAEKEAQNRFATLSLQTVR